MKTTTAALALRTLLWFGVSMGAFGAEVRIRSADEFIQFSNNVNKGTSYSGTTVFLDSDLYLSWKTFEPIGNTSSNYFNGTFDGQGHVISNLKMSSSYYYVGLFGYSMGLTIKNIILDSSCSITSTYSDSSDTYVGGIIGECWARNGPCSIENSVNMGSVTFSGTISDRIFANLFLGGVVGVLESFSYDSTVKNCANYGVLIHSGTSYRSCVGGIAGYSDSYYSSSKRAYIYNSLNHGIITHNGTTSSGFVLGGITGRTHRTTIENCVSGGKISSKKSGYIGSIVGYVSSDSSVNYCYYTSELSGYSKYGEGTPSSESNTLSYDSTSFQLDENVSIGDYTGNSLIDALNAAADYYTLRDYSNWLLNKEKKDVSFSINDISSFILNSQVILLPCLASEGRLLFDGWYEDVGLTSSFTESEITSDTELYGKWEVNANNYTISFDTRGGSPVSSITASFGSAVTLRSGLSRDHCTVAFWENKYGDKIDFNLAMPSYNITLYAVWKCTHIKTPEDLIDFSKVVNSGVDSFNGTTVFLDSDIDFTGKTFEPIGYFKSYSNYFLGVFDGQGHIISNLKMNSSSQYVGLFGYSGGLTIKNVILDSSCSITSSRSGSGDVHIGGIIGYFWARNGHCSIENSVNMGNATFSGAQSGDRLYLGGIVGYLYSSSYNHDSTVKNCANYGDVTHSGKSDYSYIGGIVGHSTGSSSKRAYIYNCLNHGTITHKGTTSNELSLGGISGWTHRTTIENCVSGGKISSKKSGNIGSIVGYVRYDTSINYCYYTSGLGFKKYGKETPSRESNTLSYDSTTFELNGTVSIGDYTGNSLIDALNAAADYYTLRDYSNWLLNKEKKDVSFIINERSNAIEVNYQIILLPSLANEGNMSFDGWFKDSGLTTPLASYEISSETELYGKYCGPNFTVTLDVNGGDELAVREMTIGCDRVYGDLPTPTRTEATFLGWFTGKGERGELVKSNMAVKITQDHTLYAHWAINNYTLTFIFDNGTEPEVRVLEYNTYITYPVDPVRTGYSFTGWSPKPERMPANNTNITTQWSANNYTVTFDASGGNISYSTKTVTFDTPYGELPIPNKMGFTFSGWFNEKNESVTNESIVKTPNNHTLHANWTEVPTNQSEVLINAGNLTWKEIEEIIKQYTNDEFVIIKIDYDSSCGTLVIIEFNDAEKAESFVENVKASNDGKATITKVGFIQEGPSSFSISFHPMKLFLI